MRRSSYTRIVLGLTALVAAIPAGADTIEVDGTVLDATITSISASGVDIETKLGKGTITVAYDEIERVETEVPFWVLYGEEDEVSGRILGIEDGQLLVGEDRESAARIDPSTIYVGSAIDGEISEWARQRARWRFWSAAFDAGFNVTDATTDTTNASLGFVSERRKTGSRFVAKTGYIFGTQKKQGGSRSTLNNEVSGLLKGEYDLSEHLLLIASADAEYDEIERLSIRTVPKAGLGWRLWKTKTSFFQLEAAPAYNYERFFGGDTNSSAAASFGAEAETVLPYSAVVGGRVDYLPAVTDWADDYLIRSEITLSVPIISMLSLKATLSDQYDNTPASGNQRNELQTSLGLALRL